MSVGRAFIELDSVAKLWSFPTEGAKKAPARRARMRHPQPHQPPASCSFHTRCPVAEDRCSVEEPEFIDVTGDGHFASCHLIGPRGEAPRIVKEDSVHH